MRRLSGYYHFIALILASLLTCDALANDALDKALFERVDKAQNQLAQTEQQIAKQRAVLSNKLEKLEQQVATLREKTAAARRVSDEKTLSLGQLESRIKQWREQQVYQANLLNRFIQKQQLASSTNTLKPEQKFKLINDYAAQMQQKLTPSWQQTELVLTSGKIVPVDTLSVGPLHWYWLTSEQRAGLASIQNGQLYADLLLSESASQGIAELYKNSAGELVFDPTMGKVLAREQHTESPWQHLQKGGVWVVPIMLFALLALSIALYKSWQLIRLPKVTHYGPNQINSLLYQTHSPLLQTIKGKQLRLLDIAKQACSERTKDDQLFVQLQQDRLGLERWLLVIGITASVAPLLGLLGTVSGMIETFKMMTLFGSGDPDVVSGGIAQALITTELGLVVAIPALVLNAILSKRAKSYYQQLENFAILLSQPPSDSHSDLQQVAA